MEVERIDRADAEKVADLLVDAIGHTTVRLVIAGSIRRKTRTVKDIEVVLEPRVVPAQENLFGDVTEEKNETLELMNKMVSDRLLYKRQRADGQECWGPKHQRAVFRNIPIDFFMVTPPAQWGVVLAIRTGPWDWSKYMVTPKYKGGLMPEGLAVREGALWRIDRQGDPVGMVPCASEEEFFLNIGAKWIPPEDRWKALPEDWVKSYERR